MSFSVTADAYDRFMGRYSVLLAEPLADLAGVTAGQRVLDVGCGPGALTSMLVARLGAASVSAVDPSEPFVAAAAARHPGVDVRTATAEDLPYRDGTFDAAIAQLVVHFMRDPARGIAEMVRVTRRDGVIAACVWDHQGGTGPLSFFWEVVHEIDPGAEGEAALIGSTAGDLLRLFSTAGLRDVTETSLSADLEHETFDAWWEPFTLSVGPAGSYVAGQTPERVEAMREQARERIGPGPFVITARAWAARGTV